MCLRGFTSRCSTSKLLGTTTLPGAQAQYIRIPNAGGSLIPAAVVSFPSPSPSPSQAQAQAQAQAQTPSAAEDKLRKEALTLLLADILPTGYFAAKQAWDHPNLSGMLKQIRDRPDEPKIQLAIHFAILGLGPVGLVSVSTDWPHLGLTVIS
jgi:threonine dehydrogenase-like Zn-dependent dehydrogenase